MKESILDPDIILSARLKEVIAMESRKVSSISHRDLPLVSKIHLICQNDDDQLFILSWCPIDLDLFDPFLSLEERVLIGDIVDQTDSSSVSIVEPGH